MTNTGSSSDTREYGPVAVLGSGDWGSTLGWMLCNNANLSEVRLWGRDKEKIDQMRKTKILHKTDSLPVPDKLKLEDDLSAAVHGARVIVMACTSQTMRELSRRLNQVLSEQAPEQLPLIVNVAKGLELDTFMRMSQVIESEIQNASAMTLSGPNLAFEIRNQLPCASSLAGKDNDDMEYAQKCLNTSLFRIYTNHDIVGVEFGGTLKNIIAIAAGGSDGLGLGVNAKAALLTRGLREMTRFAVKFGAKESTLFGLSGVGDLMATCQGSLSRNYRVGYHIAQGKTLNEALELVQSTAEGVNTTFAVVAQARELGVELPIAEQVAQTLKGEISPDKSIPLLMKRPLGTE
jgi:glycerol-3-phosphate dehydrogenase (NAD(P)+)